MTRTIVVERWTGMSVVAELRFTAAQVDVMSDDVVTKHLRTLSVAAPATEVERRARLKEFPTQADLDAIAVAWIPWNDGVRPVVRVLETDIPRSSLVRAGTVPHG